MCLHAKDCGQKDSIQRIFIKKCSLFRVGSVCRVKRITAVSKSFADDEEVETEVRKWLRQHTKDCGFRRTGKAMGQVYLCWWRICREINVLSRFEYQLFYISYPFVTCLLTLPRVRSVRFGN
jgi:hypothetical protein